MADPVTPEPDSTSEEPRPVPGRASKAARYVAAVVVWMLLLAGVPAIAWLVVGSAVARSREAALEQRVRALVGAGRPLPQVAVGTAANASAARLTELAADLGLTLAPSASPQAASGFSGVAGELDAWVNGELDRGRDPVAPPPAAVAAFLADHAPTLGGLRAQLATGEPPRFAVEPRVYRRLKVAPEDLLRLQWLLVADCLEASARGEQERVGQAVLAAWGLDQSLLDQADVHTLPVALEAVKVHAQLVRRLDVERSAWLERLRGCDVRAVARRVLAEQAWLWVDGVRTARIWQEASVGGPWPPLEPLARPWLRMGATEAGELTVDALDELEPNGGLGVDAEVAEQLWQQRLSPRNLVARLAWASPLEVVQEAAWVALEQELTARVLELRDQAEKLGSWPKELADPGCRAVKGLHWELRPSASGGPTLRLVGEALRRQPGEPPQAPLAAKVQ